MDATTAPAATAAMADPMADAAAPDAAMTMAPAVQPDAGASMDLGLPGATDAAAQPAPVMDDVAPATPIDAPQDDFDQAIAAADQVESSVDDLFEGA
jgi:hypothetical protein